MKTKNLLKKAFLLLALIGGASSAWATTKTFSLVSYTVTDGKYTVTDGATLTLGRTSGNIGGADGKNRGFRWQQNMYFQIVVPSGQEVTSVTLTSNSNGNSVNSITYSLTDGTNGISGSWDNAPNSGKQTAYTWTVTEGMSYGAWVLTNTGSTGDIYVSQVSVTYETASTTNTPPSIVTQPTSAVTTSVGHETSLTVAASGYPAPTYQWYSCDDTEKSNASAIGGATSATYTFTPVSTGTYYYFCRATNNYESADHTADSNVSTVNVNQLYNVTYSLGDVTGTKGKLPDAEEVASSVTIPSNWLLYKDGCTLTAWNDGSANHAIGSTFDVSSDVTLTPVFSPNGENAHLGYNATTVTWDFQTKNGAPTWQLEGNTGVQITQTTVGGSSIDVKLDIDATSGKLNNASWTDWAQFNEGTKLTVPVLNGAVVKMFTMNEGSGTTFGGNPADSYASNIHSYTATSDGDLEVVAGSGVGYVRYISVTYPVKGVKIYDYETSVGTGVVGETDNVSSTTQSINGSSVDVIKMTSNLNSGNNNNYWKITPSAGTFKKGDRIIWTGCYSNSSTKETTIVIFDDDAISSAIVTGESFANVNGGTTVSPKSLTTGSFILTADAEALYIGRNGSTNTYLTALTVVRENETATIGDMGYTTFSSSYPLNLDGIAGGTAYKVAESGVTAKVVTPEAVTGTIAAGEGLILSGIAGATVTIPVAASGDAISGNLMVGCPTGATLNSSTPNYETCYVLINGTTEAEFANLTNWISGGQEVNIPAGKAYLNTTASNSARSLRISFGNITNVANVEAAAEAKAQDGKFIENGKLVIVKNGKKFNANGQQVK